MRSYCGFSVWVVCVSSAVVGYAQSPDLTHVAQDVAGKLAAQLAHADGKPTVAVFPFSNANGEITPEMGNMPIFLQGELIHWLTQKSNGNFFVLNKGALARRLKTRDIDLKRIDASDPRLTATTMHKAGIDFALLGSLDGLLANELKGWDDVKINAGLFGSDGNVRQLVGKLDRFEANSFTPSGPPIPKFQKKRRLMIEILVGGQALPMKQCHDEDSPFCGALFVVVPRSALGREYQIRITNNGSPSIDSLRYVGGGNFSGTRYQSDYDQRRLIGIAVCVDGVSTIFETDDDGDYQPVARAPEGVQKWLLSPPGTVIRQSNRSDTWKNGWLRINHGQVTPYSGYGNAQLTIKGFQASDDTAQAFVFGDASQSLAEMIGITKDIGLISLYVFPEVVPDEKSTTMVFRKLSGPDGDRYVAETRTGTLPGRPLKSNITGFQVNLVEKPRQVWNIYYRLEGESLPVTPSQLAPFRQ